MKTVLGDIRRADEDFEMIAPGDRVAIGVSGGKDSLFCSMPFRCTVNLNTRILNCAGLCSIWDLKPSTLRPLCAGARN